jgi:hypothetical protein
MRSLPSAKGHEHDLKVKDGIPIFDIINIAPNAFAQVCVAAEAIDLSPTGHARDDIVTGIVIKDLFAESLDELRALWTRSDQA